MLMVLGVLRMLSYHGASAMVAQDQAYETTAREGKKGLFVHMDTELILLGESLARRRIMFSMWQCAGTDAEGFEGSSVMLLRT